MLNSDLVAQLRHAVSTAPDITEFHGLAIGQRVLRCPSPGNWATLSLGDPFRAQLQMPSHIFGTPFDATCLHGIGPFEFDVPEPKAFTIKKASVIGFNTIISEYGEVFTPDPLTNERIKNFLSRNAENHYGYAAIESDNDIVAYYVRRQNINEFDLNALYIHNLEPGNYGSFLFRQLPQILYAMKIGIDFDAYITPERTPWFSEALNIVGLPKRPVFSVREISGDKFNNITIINEIDAEGFFSSESMKKLHELSTYASNNYKCVTPKNIYVSRLLSSLARPDYRVLQTEEGIENFLKSRGFSIIYPETLSFLEQIAIFRDAEKIVGPSGSGMLNAIFSRPGTKILDMESFHYTVRQHAKIYSSSGMEYSFLFGDVDASSRLPPYARPWSVPRALLDEACEWLCS